MVSPDTSATVVARLCLDESAARRLADQLAEVFAPGEAAVAAADTGEGSWVVEVCFEAAPDQSAVRSLVALAAGEQVAGGLTFATVVPKDWVAASLAGLQPVPAGRFLVHGAHDRARVRANTIGIEIEAALAFGTGHHGTTRGCLLALDRWSKTPAGRRRPAVLDVGTGTGVLAIAAAMATRRRVVASDIDRQAVEVARANARSNHVGPWIEVVHAAGLTAGRLRARGPYGLVLANILLPPLKRMAAAMARLVAPGGHVVLSGLLDSHAAAALAAYRAQGLALVARGSLEGWTTLVLQRAAHGRRRPHRARRRRAAS